MAHDFGDAANSVRELFFSWQYREHRTLSKVSVADFAAAWATKAADFTHGVAWCVVVVHVAALAVSDFHGINDLGEAQRC